MVVVVGRSYRMSGGVSTLRAEGGGNGAVRRNVVDLGVMRVARAVTMRCDREVDGVLYDEPLNLAMQNQESSVHPESHARGLVAHFTLGSPLIRSVIHHLPTRQITNLL